MCSRDTVRVVVTFVIVTTHIAQVMIYTATMLPYRNLNHHPSDSILHSREMVLSPRKFRKCMSRNNILVQLFEVSS